MIEVDRPDRKTRSRQGKSEPIDAIAAAKTALAGDRTGIPKQPDGRVEALRNLRVARRGAVEQRADTQRQIKTLIVTAPDQLRARLTTEITNLDEPPQPLAAAIDPGLVTAHGVGTDTAGQLLVTAGVTAGENHHRLTSDAAPKKAYPKETIRCLLA